MDYLDKIKTVRENIKDWQKEHGNEFSYVITGFYEGDDPIYDSKTILSKEEHKEIVKYFERRKLIEILNETRTSLKIKILPKENPIIKLKTLELISRELKDHYTGYEITKLLEECGVEKKFIKYPTSKWFIFYSLFEELATGQDEKAKNLLFKIISEAVHPLNLSGNTELSESIVKKFNEYLKYDNLGIFYSNKSQKYELISTDNATEISREDIMQDTSSLTEEILPDINKSSFSERVLELVADLFIKNLSECNVRYIITPLLNKSLLLSEPFVKNYIADFFDEKIWHYNFYSILKFIRRKDENADKTIAGIIEKLLHPLNYNADEEKADNIAKSIGKYLKYDNFYVQNIGKEYLVLSDEEMTEMHTSSQEFNEQDKENKKNDEKKIKQNKENLKLLREIHQTYIDILEIFCRDTKKPTKELNDAYVFLSNKLGKDVKKLELETSYYHIYFYKPFENDLYSAETEWNKKGKKLSWDEIRPVLYKAHSDITKLINMNEEDIIMTDEEKKLENITKLISEKRIQEIETAPSPIRIEISKMPDLNIKNKENNIVVKNNKKRITLPKFPRTEWSKVSMTFIEERNILLSDSKNTKPSSFEGLGCDDSRTGKPDDSWNFLLQLAKGNGQTLPISKKEREKRKKQKQKVTDILRNVFQNDTDPFEIETGGVYKAKFNIKYTADNSDNKPKNSKYSDSEEVFSEMTESVEGEFSQ
ncbi:MAG: hypothetical protein EOM78_13980 [Erysipelotrichia bacterium]|nr:hypothetical protein [Erysipelotrichia bacterium]